MYTPVLSNLQPSPIDPRDFVASLPIVANLPAYVDLKPYVTEVEDQGAYSSCTANAGASALELMFKQSKNIKYDFSRMFLYYYDRQLSGLGGADQGAYPRSIGEALHKYGVCLESTWDYTFANLNVEPPDNAINEAGKFKILSYAQLVGNKLNSIKNSVAQGVPVLLTMAVHPGFMTLRGDWKTHAWDISGPNIGYHEVLVIGYDDKSERLLLENSWAPIWGDGGFCGMPYSIVDSIVSELWIITPNYNTDVLPVPDPIPVPPKNNLSLPIFVIASIVLGALYLLYVGGH